MDCFTVDDFRSFLDLDVFWSILRDFKALGKGLRSIWALVQVGSFVMLWGLAWQEVYSSTGVSQYW